MSREGDRESGHEHSLRGQMEGNSGLWFAEALLVVVILMATVAFQARLNPPGGVWQETGHHNLTADSPMQYSHKAGQSTLWDVNKYRYRWFAISNDITLSLSLLAIQLLLARSFFKSDQACRKCFGDSSNGEFCKHAACDAEREPTSAETPRSFQSQHLRGLILAGDLN